MNAQTKWSYAWFLEGQEVASDNGPAFSKTSGQFSLSLTAGDGFPAGNYRLELYIANKLAAASNLSVAGSGGTGGGPIGSITFAEGADRNDNPVKPHKAGEPFASGSTELYGFFDWDGMQDGWQWVSRWYIDGQLVVETPDTWAAGASGTGYWLSVYSDNGLPDGEYKLEIEVQGQVVQSGAATIGKGGAGPTPTPQPTGNGVQVTGYILDANTGKGIPGALFLVLQPGITIADFQWTDEEVYAMGEADSQGYFELPALLERGQVYSLMVGAQGYVRIDQDGVEVAADTPDVIELEIQLQKAK